MRNKTWMKRAVATGLIALMAVVNPLQNLSAGESSAPAVARAAEEDKPYVGEVRLAVDKKADKAKQILSDAGYEVIDQDLNKDAGSFWNDLGDQAVFMGIKRTADEKKAIRDMKTMNMLGKYSYTGLKERLENNKSEAKSTYEKVKLSIREYKSNYKKNDLGAQTAHDLMNMYRDDDSGKLMGDLFLEEPDEEQILKLLSEGNLHIIANIFKSLAYGVETTDDEGKTWMERLSKVTSYNAVVKKYAKELYGTESVYGEKKAEVEAVVEADLNEAAAMLLSNWGEIRKIYTDSEEDEKTLEDFDGEFEDAEELLDVTESANNVEAVSLAKSLPYGKKTLYDYFTVSTATFEKNIKNLYPLAYALSEGQRSMLEFMDMLTLIQASLIRSTANEDRSKLNDSVAEAQKTIQGVEVVSVYEGVDRSFYDDDAAMTSEAVANMSADAKSQEEIENNETWLYGCLIVTGVTTFLATACALASKILSKISQAHTETIENTFKEKLMMEYNSFVETSRSSKVAETYSSRLSYFGKMLIFVSVIMAVVSAVQYYRTMSAKYNIKQLPIPEILVDYDVESSSGRNVVYHVVKWNRNRDDGRADRGDLNGDAAREWLALYTTTDTAMGDPILADGIVAMTGNDGGERQPDTDYAPLTLFGRESIQNLVDETYSFNDDVGGIWLWYQKGGSSAETELEDDTDDAQEETLSGDKTEDEDDKDAGDAAASDSKEDKGASETGSNIGGGTMALGITGGAVGGLVIGLLIGVFFRRKKQVSE